MVWLPAHGQQQALSTADPTVYTALEKRLHTAIQQRQLLEQEQFTLQQHIANSRQLMEQLQAQTDALEGSLLLAQLLYQQQQQLPEPSPLLFSDNEIADWRIEQFELQQLIKENSNANTAKELYSHLEQTATLAIQNRGLHQELTSMLKESHELITEQLFWMPSSRPLNRHWWQQLPYKLWHDMSHAPLAPLTAAAINGIKKQWPWLLLAGLFSVGLRMYRQRWRAQLEAIQEQVGFVHYDEPFHTAKAVFLSALLALPWPLLLLASTIIWLPSYSEQPIAFAIHWQLAIALWFILWARLLLQDNGIAIGHFRWSASFCQQVSRRLAHFAWLLLPLLWCIQLGFKQPASLLSNSLAPLVFILCCAWLALLLWRPLPHQQEKLPLRQVLTSLLLIAVPFTMAAATALGYHFSAITLMQRSLSSAAVIWLSIVLYQMALRTITVLARQLAHHRAVLRRQYHEQKGDVLDNHSSAEEDALEVDLYRLNEQALQLIRWMAVLAASLVLYYLWADIIGTLSYLNRITLWQSSGGDATTLGHALGAGLILAVSLVMARNLPALVAVTLLSRLALKPGSSYTITALLTYVLTATGIVWALAVIGVSWDKLQWLVAALGFGLGFGLQEIFANFVSGIILLFERPVRVGDYVSIGTYTGTVTRIRIRATTIRDNDKREVILPNKAFVTDRFTNWTLTDTTTRISITVGFDYDADLVATKQLLLDAANNNPRVLKDPAPAALFTNFQDSTLEHTLRVHVKTLSDRSRAIDELNRNIMELARERNLNIAFNQLEVTLKNQEGKVLNMV